MTAEKLPFITPHQQEARAIIASLRKEYKLFIDNREENALYSSVEEYEKEINSLKDIW